MNIEYHNIKYVLTKQLLILVIAVFPNISLLAQDKCSMSLKRAEKLFDAGKIEEIAPLLLPCINSGFAKEQKIEAYELLIQSYLIEGNDKQAEQAMFELLELEPYYETENRILTSEFLDLFQSFFVRQYFSLGLFAGVNFPQINVAENYGVHDLNEKNGNYSTCFGYQWGFLAITELSKKLDLEVSGAYLYSNFDYKFDKMFDIVDISCNEEHKSLSFSLGIDIKHSFRSYVPYLYLGASYQYLLSAQINCNRNYVDNQRSKDVSSDFPIIDNRCKNLFDCVAGFGIRHRLLLGTAFLDFRYYRALTQSSIESKRYENEKLAYNYFLIDDKFYKNNILFSIGYSYSFIKPYKKLE